MKASPWKRKQVFMGKAGGEAEEGGVLSPSPSALPKEGKL